MILVGSSAAVMGSCGGTALAARSAAAAADSPLLCPARLASDQAATAPAGWTARRTAKDAPLEAIAIFDGDPSEHVELAPTEARPKAGWLVSQWRFDRDVKPTIACRYRGTDIVLSRALPGTIRQCTVRTRVGGGLLDPAALRCR